VFKRKKYPLLLIDTVSYWYHSEMSLSCSLCVRFSPICIVIQKEKVHFKFLDDAFI